MVRGECILRRHAADATSGGIQSDEGDVLQHDENGHYDPDVAEERPDSKVDI